MRKMGCKTGKKLKINKTVIDNKAQKFLSSNGHYGILINDGSNVLRLYAEEETSFYDFAETIYNDCIKSLNISTPFTCKVFFYHSRNVYHIFRVTKFQSIEDTLKELCKQLKK